MRRRDTSPPSTMYVVRLPSLCWNRDQTYTASALGGHQGALGTCGPPRPPLLLKKEGRGGRRAKDPSPSCNLRKLASRPIGNSPADRVRPLVRLTMVPAFGLNRSQAQSLPRIRLNAYLQSRESSTCDPRGPEPTAHADPHFVRFRSRGSNRDRHARSHCLPQRTQNEVH